MKTTDDMLALIREGKCPFCESDNNSGDGATIEKVYGASQAQQKCGCNDCGEEV